MAELWKQIEPAVINALLVIIPVAGGTLIAWLKRLGQRALVKGIVAELDSTPAAGPEKKAAAMERISQALPKLSEERASQLIEAVLPQVRGENGGPPPSKPPAA